MDTLAKEIPFVKEWKTLSEVDGMSKELSSKEWKTKLKRPPLLVERPKPVRASPSASSSCQIRRTASLDAITENYLAGQWPRPPPSMNINQRQHDKCTQFPDGNDSNDKPGHKRSVSLDFIASGKDLKQRLKQTRARATKITSSGTAIHRYSPIHVLLRTMHTPSRFSQIPASRTRGSVEGLNAEIADLDLSGARDDTQKNGERPAPPCPRSADKETTRQCGSCESSPGTLRLCYLPNTSPRLVESKGTLTVDSDQRSESSTNMRRSPSEDLEPTTPKSTLPDFGLTIGKSSSPRPNRSYRLTRHPPDGCERVAADEQRRLPPMKDYLLAPHNDFSFKPSQNSAFAPLKGPITPQQQTEVIILRTSATKLVDDQE